MTQYGFYFDGQRCTGCKTCELACKDYHNLGTDISLRNVLEYTGGSWEQNGDLWSNSVFAYYVSVSCNHCDNPACLPVCPAGAISKDADTGIVTADAELCIGCGACATACPYSAPRVDAEKGKSIKCNLCAERIAEGLAPICVEACPLRALDWGPIDELREKYGDLAAVAPLPDASVTSPNLVIKASAHAEMPGAATGMVANENEL